MRWAIAQGYRQDNPAGDAITAALPKRPTPVQHRAALPHHEVAAAVAAVRNADAWFGTRLAFEFLVLTAARSAEVRLATWGEMDLVAMVWTVPGRRMKAKREHRVPLYGRAVEVLREAEQLRGGGERGRRRGAGVPGRSRQGARRQGALEARAGPGHRGRAPWLPVVVPGLGVGADEPPREVMEAALAHAVRNRTEAAYARSDLFERRRHLMEDWGEYLEVVRGQVVPLRRG